MMWQTRRKGGRGVLPEGSHMGAPDTVYIPTRYLQISLHDLHREKISRILSKLLDSGRGAGRSNT
jgi:hypothetical protein